MSDLAALAKGGRTNFFGFLLRLAARLPFLFIAGRMYGAETLGRFAYAIIIVEFAAQLATLGLKRGLAQQLSLEERPDAHVVWDGLVVGWVASALAGGGVVCAQVGAAARASRTVELRIFSMRQCASRKARHYPVSMQDDQQYRCTSGRPACVKLRRR